MNRYLKEKRAHVTDKTLYNYSTATGQFVDWLEDNGHIDLRDVDSDVVDQFKEYRLEKVKSITARILIAIGTGVLAGLVLVAGALVAFTYNAPGVLCYSTGTGVELDISGQRQRRIL